MKINILVEEGEKSKKQKRDNTFYIDSFSKLSKNVEHDIGWIIRKHKLSPSEEVLDFLNLAYVVYTIDQLFSRKKHGYYGWNRHFHIHIAVKNLKLWENISEKIAKTFSFLSGDKYELSFAEREEKLIEEAQLSTDHINNVVLLSGGLDSFLGAISVLKDNKKTAFVSHHKRGNAGELTTQAELYKALSEKYKNNASAHYKFYVQPKGTESELSQRARSIIFIALGILVANSYGEEVPLIIPENGYISLNVPLVSTRIGSLSTKTTHPHYINNINEILEQLGVKNRIINPYKYKTKGEMLESLKTLKIVKDNLSKTLSCSKAGYYERLYKRKEKQCGFCTPCIIRRSAVFHAKMDKYDSDYVFDLNKTEEKKNSEHGGNASIFLRGARKFKKEHAMFDVLKSGSIPGDEASLKEYAGVYERGLKEVENFLKK